MLDVAKIAVIALVLVAGCSKKKDASGAGSAAAPPAATGSATAAPATAPAAPASAAPSAAGAAACADCQKFTTCCQALAAIADSGVDKSDCEGNPGETRLELCAKASAEMQPDANSTCKDRLADLQKAHADVAACK